MRLRSRRSRRSGTAKLATIASRLRALGACAHYDTSHGFVDTPGVGSTWSDSISGEVQASTSSATRLVYSASQASLNGRPGWTATAASSTKLTKSSSALAALLDGSAAFTAISVRAASAGVSAGSVWSLAGTTGFASDPYVAAVTAAVTFERYDGAYASVAASGSPGTAATVDTVVFDGSSAVVLCENGSQVGSGSVAIYPACDALTIGARDLAGAFDRYFDGAIGDIVLFPRALATTEH